SADAGGEAIGGLFASDRAYQAALMFSGVNGSIRTRFPVAAKIAFAIAPWITAVPGSPKPPGGWLGAGLSHVISIFLAASFMRTMRYWSKLLCSTALFLIVISPHM